MPKLASDLARAAEQAAEGGNEDDLVPEGIYIGKLFEVTVSDKPGASGYNFWMWKFKLEDEGYKGNEQVMITSLSPKADFAFGYAFAAFGVPADTDTDELCGQFVRLNISIVIQEKGPAAGTRRNRVESIMPLEDGDMDGQSPLDDEF